jgi:hypothetical protein
VKRVLFILLSAAAVAIMALLTTDAPLAQRYRHPPPPPKLDHGKLCWQRAPGVSASCASGLRCEGFSVVPCPSGRSMCALGVCCYKFEHAEGGGWGRTDLYCMPDPCPFNQVRNPRLGGDCVPCPAGTHADPDLGYCLLDACPPGTHREATGWCAPDPCPPGSHREGAQCVPDPCPTGQVRTANASNPCRPVGNCADYITGKAWGYLCTGKDGSTTCCNLSQTCDPSKPKICLP